MDDLVSGANDVKEGYEISVKAAKIMQKAGMRFRKWGTSSEELRQLWEKHADTTGEIDLFDKEIATKETKVLGLKWEPKTDTFAYNLTILIEGLKNPKNTKRCVYP